MRSYNRGLLRDQFRRESANHVETRDAILWDVIPEKHICRLKLQGSNNLVEARYPVNLEKEPVWLKPGNSVKVMHTNGNRHSIEVVGRGLFVPTPSIDKATGLPAASAPVIAVGADCVISGCLVHALPDTQSMVVTVDVGYYRISGVTYALGPMTMDEANPVIMASGVKMDLIAGGVTLAAAHPTLVRIDSVVVGTDGVLNVVTGTNSTNNPQIPTTPGGHVLLGTVLVLPASTFITEIMVNETFTPPFLSKIEINPYLSVAYWTDATVDIIITLKDQYDRVITDRNYSVYYELTSGSGNFGATFDGAILSATHVAYSGSLTITYHRAAGYDTDPGVVEHCPVVINLHIVEQPSLVGTTTVLLMNETEIIII